MLFSVLIPNLGFDDKFKRCIQSILSSYDDSYDFEIIICDQSDEQIYDAIKNYCLFDKRIKIIRQNDKNVLLARHALLDAAKGEYVVFVDSDDYVKEGYLDFLYSVICNSKNPDLIILEHYVVENGKTTYVKLPSDVSENFSRYFYLTGYLNPLWIKIFKRKLYKKEDYTDFQTINGDDWVLSKPIVKKSKKILFEHQAYYYYVINNNGLSHKLTLERAINSINLKDNDIQSKNLSSTDASYLIETKMNYYISFAISLVTLCGMTFRSFIKYSKIVRENIYLTMHLKNKMINKGKTKICGFLLKNRLYFIILFYIKYLGKKALKN